jgi:hypothetical protein
MITGARDTHAWSEDRQTKMTAIYGDEKYWRSLWEGAVDYITGYVHVLFVNVTYDRCYDTMGGPLPCYYLLSSIKVPTMILYGNSDELIDVTPMRTGIKQHVYV